MRTALAMSLAIVLSLSLVNCSSDVGDPMQSEPGPVSEFFEQGGGGGQSCPNVVTYATAEGYGWGITTGDALTMALERACAVAIGELPSGSCDPGCESEGIVPGPCDAIFTQYTQEFEPGDEAYPAFCAATPGCVEQGAQGNWPTIYEAFARVKAVQTRICDPTGE